MCVYRYKCVTMCVATSKPMRGDSLVDVSTSSAFHNRFDVSRQYTTENFYKMLCVFNGELHCGCTSQKEKYKNSSILCVKWYSLPKVKVVKVVFLHKLTSTKKHVTLCENTSKNVF